MFAHNGRKSTTHANIRTDPPEGGTVPQRRLISADCLVSLSAVIFVQPRVHTQGDSDVVPYLCQLLSAAILWVKLREMFATLMSLKYSLSAG